MSVLWEGRLANTGGNGTLSGESGPMKETLVGGKTQESGTEGGWALAQASCLCYNFSPTHSRGKKHWNHQPLESNTTCYSASQDGLKAGDLSSTSRTHIRLLAYHWHLKRRRCLPTNANNDRSWIFLQFHKERGSNLDSIWRKERNVTPFLHSNLWGKVHIGYEYKWPRAKIHKIHSLISSY